MMLNTRLRVRAAAAFLAGVAVVFGVFFADQAFAADSLRITSPQAGASVSGDVLVEGEVAGSGQAAVTLSLAPQVLGECRPSVVERIVTVEAGEPFAATLPTAGLEAGPYCVVALSDDGVLSSAVGDVTIAPAAAAIDDMQLPTLALPAETPAAATDLGALGAEILIPTALGTVAAVSVVVLSAGLVYRRRQLQDS